MKDAICLDFDGVLHQYTTPFTNAWTIPDLPVAGSALWLIRLMEVYDVYVLSGRGGRNPWWCRWWHQWMARRAIRRWLRKWYGNTVASRITVIGVKIPCKVYIDDRGFRFVGTFPDIGMLRKLRPWNDKDEV